MSTRASTADATASLFSHDDSNLDHGRSLHGGITTGNHEIKSDPSRLDAAGGELVTAPEYHRIAFGCYMQPGALKLDIFAQYAASKWPTQGASAGTGASRDGCDDVDPGLEAAMCWAFREPDVMAVPQGLGSESIQVANIFDRKDKPDTCPLSAFGGMMRFRRHRDPMVCDFSPRMREEMGRMIEERGSRNVKALAAEIRRECGGAAGALNGICRAVGDPGIDLQHLHQHSP